MKAKSLLLTVCSVGLVSAISTSAFAADQKTSFKAEKAKTTVVKSHEGKKHEGKCEAGKCGAGKCGGHKK